jgi:hypothetical protein
LALEGYPRFNKAGTRRSQHATELIRSCSCRLFMVFGSFSGFRKRKKRANRSLKILPWSGTGAQEFSDLGPVIEAMRIPARLYRGYPEHWIRFMENSRYQAVLALILFKILVMGSVPPMKIYYSTDVLDLASFLHACSSSPRILTRSRQRNRRRRGSRRSLNHLL